MSLLTWSSVRLIWLFFLLRCDCRPDFLLCGKVNTLWVTNAIANMLYMSKFMYEWHDKTSSKCCKTASSWASSPGYSLFGFSRQCLWAGPIKLHPGTLQGSQPMPGLPDLLSTILSPDMCKPGLSRQTAGLRLGTARLQGAPVGLCLSPRDRANGNLKFSLLIQDEAGELMKPNIVSSLIEVNKRSGATTVKCFWVQPFLKIDFFLYSFF